VGQGFSDECLSKMIKVLRKGGDREEGTGNKRNKKKRGNRWGKRKEIKSLIMRVMQPTRCTVYLQFIQ
jgi:hypothetical protein